MARRREQLKGVLAAMWGRSVLVLGDLNARGGEVEALTTLREEGLEDMVYLGRSWNVQENGYFEEHKGQGGRAPARSFDRILFGGEVFAAGYLVGQGRCFAEDAVFALSDHYGLMALVDVNDVRAGLRERGRGVAGRRREALGIARDQAVLKERVVVKELQAAALEQARRQRAREEEDEGVQRRQAERKKLAAGRRARYEAAFGRESLFGAGGAAGAFWEGPEAPGGAQGGD